MSMTTLPATRVGVLANGVLDAGVVDGEHDDVASEGVARIERAGRAA